MPSSQQIDPRGPRFAAGITTVVLAAVLVTGWWPLLAAQAVVFAAGALFGLRFSPYGLLYRVLIQARLGPPAAREDEAPPRFAQAVGLTFAVIGVLGYASGLITLGIVATAAALFAAFLNVAFDFCLGCEAYLLLKRVGPAAKPPEFATPEREQL